MPKTQLARRIRAPSFVNARPQLYRRLADLQFVMQLASRRGSIDGRRLALPDGGIDAEALAAERAVETHSELADQYFRSETDSEGRDSHMIKPFTDGVEAANHL